MPSKIDLTGKIIGRLTVIEPADLRYSKGGYPKLYWKCVCSCGKKIEVSASGLNHKHRPSESCGCIQKEWAKTRGLYNFKGEGVAATNNLFTRYKRGARYRNYSFKLTREDFVKLIDSNCFYCGDKPKSCWRRKEVHGNRIYNGIDRIDNNRGYELDNVVTCCITCNKSKMELSKNDFFDMIKKIYERHIK